MRTFYIMNKDVQVAEFIVSSEPYPQLNITEIFIDSLLPLPIYAIGFNKWLDNRLILSHRRNVMKMFAQIGITKLEDVLVVTKGISLNDTYWVKEAGSRITWKGISPYTNPLNKEIADYSFDRTVEGKNITHSPDFATSGHYPKCWKRINGNLYLIKAGSSGHATAGNEPYSEIYAYKLAKQLGIDCIEYKFIKYKGVNATRCLNMCTEEVGIYPFYEVFPNILTYSNILDVFNQDKKSQTQVLDMLLLDYLTLNTDRHLGNISLFVTNATQQLLCVTPVYDNNISFLPNYLEQFDGNIDNYLNNKYDGKEALTADGTSFEDMFALIDCTYIRNKLKALQGFTFKEGLPRDKVANQVLKRQLSKIKR